MPGNLLENVVSKVHRKVKIEWNIGSSTWFIYGGDGGQIMRQITPKVGSFSSVLIWLTPCHFLPSCTACPQRSHPTLSLFSSPPTRTKDHRHLSCHCTSIHCAFSLLFHSFLLLLTRVGDGGHETFNAPTKHKQQCLVVTTTTTNSTHPRIEFWRPEREVIWMESQTERQSLGLYHVLPLPIYYLFTGGTPHQFNTPYPLAVVHATARVMLLPNGHAEGGDRTPPRRRRR